MTRSRLTRMFLLGAAAVLTLGLSYGIASACADSISGSTGASYDCELTGEDANYCYYECTCNTDWDICIKNMHMDGFLIQGIDY